jgi:PPOX class probable F420-dependent enzyme
MTRRTVEELGDLLDLPYVAVLSTWREDGTALLSPVWHEWRDGGFTVDIPVGDIKLRHLQRDPHATIVVYDHAWPSRGFEVSGVATIGSEDPETTRRIAVRYLGPTNGPRYLEGVGASVIVRLEPGRARGWDFVDVIAAEPGIGVPTPTAPHPTAS